MKENGANIASKRARGVPKKPWTNRSRKKTHAARIPYATLEQKYELGVILAAILAPRGSCWVAKILIFWSNIGLGLKKRFLGAFLEKHQTFIVFWCQNDRLLKSKIMLKRCTVVQKRGFGASRKVTVFRTKMDVKKHEFSLKVGRWSAPGPFFFDSVRFQKG